MFSSTCLLRTFAVLVVTTVIMHFVLDAIDAVRVAETGLFILGGCELLVQMASQNIDVSADMSNSMSSNNTSSLDVTHSEKVYQEVDVPVEVLKTVC